MLQNSENYSHYAGEGTSWKNFDKKLKYGLYETKIESSEVACLFAKDLIPEKAMQDEQLMNFWQQFFCANAIPVGWILMDG